MNSFQHQTDAELILIYQKTNDAQAFGELYNRYNKNVFLYCSKLLNNRDRALDLTQDVFIKIAANLGRLIEPLAFVKWMFRIARNGCMNVLKKNQKNRIVSIGDSDFLESEVDTEAALEKEQLLNQMEAAFEQLKDKERAILIEKYFEKKSIAEICEKYGMSKSAVKMRLNRSREKMRVLVAAM